MSFDENEGLCPPFLNPIPDYQNLLSRLELLPADDNDRPLPASPKSYVSSDATDPDPDIVLRPRPRTTDWTGADEAIERFTQYFKQFNENFRRVTQLVDKMKPPPENHFRRQPIASPPRVSSPQQASPRPGRIPADEDDYVPLFTVRQVPPEATGRIVEPVGRKRVKWEGHEETMAARKPAFEQSAEKLKRVAQFTNQLCPPNYTFQTQHQGLLRVHSMSSSLLTVASAKYTRTPVQVRG